MTLSPPLRMTSSLRQLKATALFVVKGFGCSFVEIEVCQFSKHQSSPWKIFMPTAYLCQFHKMLKIHQLHCQIF